MRVSVTRIPGDFFEHTITKVYTGQVCCKVLCGPARARGELLSSTMAGSEAVTDNSLRPSCGLGSTADLHLVSA